MPGLKCGLAIVAILCLVACGESQPDGGSRNNSQAGSGKTNAAKHPAGTTAENDSTAVDTGAAVDERQLEQPIVEQQKVEQQKVEQQKVANSLADNSAVAAEAHYQRACSSCHGAKGEGNPALQAPALAAQAAAYLQRQLRNFAEGLRGAHPQDAQGRMMVPMATALSPVERSELASYLASLPGSKAAAATMDTSSAGYKKGRNYYQSYCGSCHGYRAEGNAQLQAPKLSGMDPGYLARQYRNFAQGLRGQHPEDKYGRQMRAIAAGFSDAARLDDVIAYIGSIK